MKNISECTASAKALKQIEYVTIKNASNKVLKK